MADHFFPLDTPIDKVILVHSFAGGITEQNGQKVATFPAKIYDYFDEVVELLKPIVEPAGYRFYQIGAPGEPPLRGAECLCGKTTMLQCAYLVKHAALLIGNDSQWAHVRGWAGKPLIVPYGATSFPHHPYWKNDKVVLIESHRGGKKPSYASHEGPKTINWVQPEQIASAALPLLGINAQINHHSIFIGDSFNQHLVELVPNVVVHPNVTMNGPLLVRMDYLHDEEKLAANVQLRKCAIVADQEISLDLLARLKPNIFQMRLDVAKLSPGWLKRFKRLGIPTGFFCNERDPDKLAKLRLDLHSVCLFDQFTPPTKDDLIKGAAVYLNKELDKDFKWDTLRFKSHRMLLSDDKIYLSKAHWRAGLSTPDATQNSAAVIDAPTFWEELPSHYYYTT